jgi:hypothetical protein
LFFLSSGWKREYWALDKYLLTFLTFFSGFLKTCVEQGKVLPFLSTGLIPADAIGGGGVEEKDARNRRKCERTGRKIRDTRKKK